jgi:putative ABC transport system ATP-binding protein
MNDQTDNLIELTGIDKTFVLSPTVSVQVLFDVDLTVKRGELVAIIGPSGSGKSTLMNIIGCLDTPSKGTYTLDGRMINDLPDSELANIRSTDISFIFQSFHLLESKSVVDNVMLPLLYQEHITHGHHERVEDALKKAALPEDHFHHRPNQLSGGQRQRVAIARALVTNPKLLLADEPTGNLDSKTGESVLDALTRLNREYGTTIVIVTHDESITSLVDRVVTIKDGRVHAS